MLCVYASMHNCYVFDMCISYLEPGFGTIRGQGGRRGQYDAGFRLLGVDAAVAKIVAISS